MTTKPKKTPAPKPVSTEMINFLLGEGLLDGTQFGEAHRIYPGNYWWRAFLRADTKKSAAPIPLPPAVRRLIKAALALTQTSYTTGATRITLDSWKHADFCDEVDAYRKSIAKGAKK